ncbi:MAG: hypothetical protein ACTMKZ_13695 [Brevibacterium aurantiacum]|nr:hypothetical protein [Brevibacterium aurantiacum]
MNTLISVTVHSMPETGSALRQTVDLGDSRVDKLDEAVIETRRTRGLA